jgi:hypothetical protein
VVPRRAGSLPRQLLPGTYTSFQEKNGTVKVLLQP